MIPTIETLELLKALPLAKDGECFWVVEKNCAYVRQNGDWIPQPQDTNISLGTLYEMNKEIISQLPGLTPEKWMEAYDLITDFIKAKNNKYFMLLSHEFRYYTVFARVGAEQPVAEAIGECLHSWVVKTIDLTPEGDAIEIWADIPERGLTVFYFFSYDSGVCECK